MYGRDRVGLRSFYVFFVYVSFLVFFVFISAKFCEFLG